MLSGCAHWLLLQESWVQFLASMWQFTTSVRNNCQGIQFLPVSAGNECNGTQAKPPTRILKRQFWCSNNVSLSLPRSPTYTSRLVIGHLAFYYTSHSNPSSHCVQIPYNSVFPRQLKCSFPRLPCNYPS